MIETGCDGFGMDHKSHPRMFAFDAVDDSPTGTAMCNIAIVVSKRRVSAFG